MSVKLKNPLILIQDTGITISNTGFEWDGSSPINQQVSLGNDIRTTGNVQFNSVTASAPSDMTSTSENDFVFFINGQYMEHDAITIQQASSTFYLKVDTDSIGYELESDDEILAWGKFNS